MGVVFFIITPPLLQHTRAHLSSWVIWYGLHGHHSSTSFVFCGRARSDVEYLLKNDVQFHYAYCWGTPKLFSWLAEALLIQYTFLCYGVFFHLCAMVFNLIRKGQVFHSSQQETHLSPFNSSLLSNSYYVPSDGWYKTLQPLWVRLMTQVY